MGLFIKHIGVQKRKSFGRRKRRKSAPTDIVIPGAPSPVRSFTPALMEDKLVAIDQTLWDALKLEVQTHLHGRVESTVDRLATALKNSIDLATFEKHEKIMEELNGKLQKMSVQNTNSLRQGLTRLEQAPESQNKKISSIDEAMDILKTVFFVEEDREGVLQEGKKTNGSFMGLAEYKAFVRRNVAKLRFKGIQIARQRLHGISLASSRKKEATEKSYLDILDAEHNEATRKEYVESQLRAMPESVRDKERERIAEREREAEARESATSLLRPLSAEDQIRVNEAIYGNGRPDDILCRVGTDSVQRESLHRLQPGQWLNDEVIHYFYIMLANRDQDFCKNDPYRKPSHFFKSFFVTKLLNQGHANPRMEGKYEYNQVKRWSKNVPGKDLFALDKIFFPINQGNSHWVCAVAFMKEKRIQMFDSLHGPGQQYLEAIFQYLKDDHKDKKKCEMPDQDEWELISTQADTPSQQNGYDCGVFTCMFADFLSKDCPLVFSQEHISQCRELIALSILNGTAL